MVEIVCDIIVSWRTPMIHGWMVYTCICYVHLFLQQRGAPVHHDTGTFPSFSWVIDPSLFFCDVPCLQDSPMMQLGAFRFRCGLCPKAHGVEKYPGDPRGQTAAFSLNRPSTCQRHH